MKKINSIIVSIILILCLVGVFALNVTTDSLKLDVNVSLQNSTNESNPQIEDINPYQNKEIKTLKINGQKIKFDKSIDTNLKAKLNNINNGEKEYVLMSFNKNPTNYELKQLKEDGIDVLEYLGNNSYYVKLSKKFDNLFEIKDNSLKLKSKQINDKYIVNGILENKAEYKLSKHLKNNQIGDWAKDDEGNIYLIVQFYNDVTLDEAENLMKENGFEVISRLEFINALTIKVYGGEKSE